MSNANHARKMGKSDHPQPEVPSLENPKVMGGGDESGAAGNLKKDPDEWVTGDEKMTMAQASYLKTLCEEAGEEYDPGLTKAEASKRIDELQGITGRGRAARSEE